MQSFYLSPPAAWPFKSPTIPARLMPSRNCYTRNAQGLVLVDQIDLSTLLGLGFYLYGSTPDLRDLVSKLNNSGDETKCLNGIGTLTPPTGGASLVPIPGTTHTLSADDDGDTLVFNDGSPIILTVPSGLDVGFSCLIFQIGDGQVTPTAGSGVTSIPNRHGYTKTAGKPSQLGLLIVVADTFVIFGDGA